MSGTELRAEREAVGLSLAEFARLVPCAKMDVWRWEAGRVRITAWREPQIRAALARARRRAARAKTG